MSAYRRLVLVLLLVVPSLQLSGCGTTATVPYLIGEKAAVAVAMIHGAGFTVHTEYDETADRGGFVISESPKPGERLTKGETVEIVVSGREVGVPNLQGLTPDEAVAALEARGLKSLVATAYSDDVPKGEIMYQSDEFGAPLQYGSRVVIIVSQGKKPTP